MGDAYDKEEPGPKRQKLGDNPFEVQDRPYYNKGGKGKGFGGGYGNNKGYGGNNYGAGMQGGKGIHAGYVNNNKGGKGKGGGNKGGGGDVGAAFHRGNSSNAIPLGGK